MSNYHTFDPIAIEKRLGSSRRRGLDFTSLNSLQVERLHDLPIEEEVLHYE